MTNRQIFLTNQAQTSPSPLLLEITKAKGIYMIGTDGTKYMDLISGIGVSNLGHRHKAVEKAVKKQAGKYMHLMVYGELVQSPQTALAKQLIDILPPSLNSVYFVNSGSEATEGAMKLAKRFTGRHEVVHCENAYHGSTQGALSIAGNENLKNTFRPLLPGTRQIRFGLLEDLDKISSHTAAVFMETVQGEAGIRIASHAYMKALRQKCSETGALLVLDEIQTGFGRTGSFWAFEHYGITPDILLLGKGMGGGMPIGAFIADKKIMSCLTENPVLGHITTFGGNAVCAAAALATVKTLVENKKLVQKAAEKGRLFKELLVHPAIRETRGLGLFIAVEFESFDVLKNVIDEALEAGALTDWFLFCDNSMRIAPPLIITKKQIKKACKIILKAIDAVIYPITV